VQAARMRLHRIRALTRQMVLARLEGDTAGARHYTRLRDSLAFNSSGDWTSVSAREAAKVGVRQANARYDRAERNPVIRHLVNGA
jgi:hypothetical protein